MRFEKYYEHYLTLHQHPKCRLMHFIGQIMTIGYITVSIITQTWWLLLLAPFVVYPFAWTGHYFFENNTPAAFTKPLYAKIADLCMFRDIILRRLTIW